MNAKSDKILRLLRTLLGLSAVYFLVSVAGVAAKLKKR